jgi:glycosyltransferase involved in cell wall biosynthesis
MVIGLAVGLSALTDGDEEYLFLANRGSADWLEPFLDGPCRIFYHGERPPEARTIHRVSGTLKRRTPLVARRWWGRRWPAPTAGREADLEIRPDGAPPLLASDGAAEAAGADLIHFPFQASFLTKLPTIYQPHDLQHLHLPELFTEAEQSSRELRYRTYCEEATLVVMMTSWGRRDLIARYGVDEEKVAVVNWGSVLSAYPDPSAEQLAEARARLALPEAFVLYPAQTWPHKNHRRLLEAIAIARDRHGTEIPLVCPGRRNELFPELERQLQELSLTDQVHFPGFVTTLELRSLYETATAMVFPSMFEGWGMPVCEAFSTGLPVACSSATGMSEVVSDAGLIFDPEEPTEIADALIRLWTEPELRKTLSERGRRRAERFSIDRAVRLFRAHYRRIAGRRLSADDRELLDAPPLA